MLRSSLVFIHFYVGLFCNSIQIFVNKIDDIIDELGGILLPIATEAADT